MEKALWVVGKTLEKPSAWLPWGPWAECFFQLHKLRWRLCFETAKFQELQEGAEALKAEEEETAL